MFENDDRGRIDDIFITKNCTSNLSRLFQRPVECYYIVLTL